MSCGCGVSSYSKNYARYGVGLGDANTTPDPEPKLMDVLTNAAYAGLVGAAEGYFVYGGNSQLLVPGLGSVSSPVGFGIHSLLSSAIGQYIDPLLETPTGSSGSPTYTPYLGSYQVPLLSGASQIGTHMLAGNSGVSPMNAFLIGATSEFLGEQIQKAMKT